MLPTKFQFVDSSISRSISEPNHNHNSLFIKSATTTYRPKTAKLSPLRQRLIRSANIIDYTKGNKKRVGLRHFEVPEDDSSTTSTATNSVAKRQSNSRQIRLESSRWSEVSRSRSPPKKHPIGDSTDSWKSTALMKDFMDDIERNILNISLITILLETYNL
jgi:hypothetical protein